MNAKSIWMAQPYQVDVREETLLDPAPDQVLVRTLHSAISTGTELLFYRGEFPQDIPLDPSIPALSVPSRYPLRYGYAAVGEVIACGSGVSREWLNRLVFSFQPHITFFCVSLDQVIPVPDGIETEDAVFLPNMETAVNFLMDGAPIIGESVVVLGQGIVGLLTTGLLRMFPLSRLITVDKYPLRRQFSVQLGADASLDPPGVEQEIRERIPDGADLVYEVTGVPEGLNMAVELTGFAGRIVIGSWYGKKKVLLDLGGKFHRSRIRMVSSQVSTLAPEFTGRWDKQRRFEVAWEMIRTLRPSRLITQRFRLDEAANAYQHLDQEPENYLQVVFTYDG